MDTDIPCQYEHVGGLAAGGPQRHGSGVSTNSAVDSRCEPVPNVCQNVPTSTTSDGQRGGQQVNSNVVSCVDEMMISCEAEYQLVSGSRSPVEVSCDDAACSQCPRDWRFFAARRVDLHLLLDILLARKHRDRAAREFLLGLPASILKKYEVFSRQHPIFVCLDIVN